MKHKNLFISAMAVSMLLTTTTPMEASAATKSSQVTVASGTEGVVTASSLNVRNKPSLSGKRFTSLKEGTKVTIYGSYKSGNTTWYKVKTSKGYGYVSGTYIKTLKTSSVTKTSTTSTSAKQTGTVTASSLNVRNKPSLSGKRFTSLKKGTKVTIYGSYKRGKTTWYKVKTSKGYGYVSGTYVKTSTAATTAKQPSTPKTSTPKYGTVTASSLNVRNKPSLSGKRFTSLKKGTTVSVHGSYKSGKTTWYKVKTSKGYGYVSGTYLKVSNSKPKATTSKTVTKGYQFSGKGFGHGIGMTQWGAKGMADQGHSYKDIVKYYYTDVDVVKQDTSKQDIRVALSTEKSSVVVSSRASYSLVNMDTGKTYRTSKAGVATTISYAKGTYTVSNGGKVTKTTSPLMFKPSTRPLQHKGKEYRGYIHVLPSDDTKLNVINRLNVETYLRGVVPGEMYVSWPSQALKAQVLAARTYAIKGIRPGRDFDVYDDTRSQVYAGVGIENAKVTSLINETKGEVITYDGSLINALYSSSAGGHTIDSEDLYNYAPYLRGKPDPYDKSVFATQGWKLNLSLSELTKVFKEVGTVKEVVILRSKFGRPTEIKVTGTKDTITLSGNEFRKRVGPSKFKSTKFGMKSL